MYLHDVGDMNASFTKEDMQAGYVYSVHNIRLTTYEFWASCPVGMFIYYHFLSPRSVDNAIFYCCVIIVFNIILKLIDACIFSVFLYHRKHQVFEKDLLDNYLLSIQKQKQVHINHGLSGTNQHSISEDAQAWSEGENDNTAMLPSNASWASNRDDRDKRAESVQRKSRNNSTSIDYPSIEASSAILSATVRPLTPNRDRKDSGILAGDTKSVQTTTHQPKQAKRQISGLNLYTFFHMTCVFQTLSLFESLYYQIQYKKVTMLCKIS